MTQPPYGQLTIMTMIALLFTTLSPCQSLMRRNVRLTFLTLLPLQVCIAALSFTYLSFTHSTTNQKTLRRCTHLYLYLGPTRRIASKLAAVRRWQDVRTSMFKQTQCWIRASGLRFWVMQTLGNRPATFCLHHVTHSPQPEALTVAILRDLSL